MRQSETQVDGCGRFVPVMRSVASVTTQSARKVIRRDMHEQKQNPRDSGSPERAESHTAVASKVLSSNSAAGLNQSGRIIETRCRLLYRRSMDKGTLRVILQVSCTTGVAAALTFWARGEYKFLAAAIIVVFIGAIGLVVMMFLPERRPDGSSAPPLVKAGSIGSLNAKNNKLKGSIADVGSGRIENADLDGNEQR